ncbi:MAG: S-methyl-5-thioribose-1-phosphate isomerase [Candidatus Korarchaeota archaeon]|nr:S-methyl-5-thioribose-1-phosphate isomerase [Candidatus Korarchaeota archaeon]NIU83947.1 S-methyl-5-thioribose-1-phosphate isomerase [Candidatus Thorarchaeota archaeon]NIW14075.1 S-methyl-5-thioribose-1-phosphate isomerase [Candidatus Thorarchaeota archaeon]NIW52185.1 S-methyl-5-thioribose-1-phosphate isomerase [Candidatus Korarchaeota archaeon]
MRIVENGEEKDITAVWLEDKEQGIVKMIDQRVLPWKLEYFVSDEWKRTAKAITNMVTRGAPNVGLTAAYAFYQASMDTLNDENFLPSLKAKAEEIKKARPTAVNLKNEVTRMFALTKQWINNGLKEETVVEKLGNHAEKVAEREINANRRIGEFGADFIEDGDSMLTHCNAGALATVDYGTALAPVRVATEQGKTVTVYADETRPWLQGARLTTWELQMSNIPCKLISDNAAGLLMRRGEIDLVITGTDRTALNGDVCNKIGTYKIALAAQDNDIPFYVAAPLSSIDRDLDNGKDIPIEERAAEEVTWVRGENEKGTIEKVRIAPQNTLVVNPVFDVTPNRLVTAIITEEGVFKPEELKHNLS